MSHWERIESVKAGLVGAIAFTVAYLLVLIINYYLRNTAVNLILFVKIGFAALNGFLS